MAEYENALFVAKLSLESHDCFETGRINHREVGEIDGHDALLFFGKVRESRLKLGDGRADKPTDRTKRRLRGFEVHPELRPLLEHPI